MSPSGDTRLAKWVSPDGDTRMGGDGRFCYRTVSPDGDQRRGVSRACYRTVSPDGDRWVGFIGATERCSLKETLGRCYLDLAPEDSKM